jgi:hypothetical protein
MSVWLDVSSRTMRFSLITNEFVVDVYRCRSRHRRSDTVARKMLAQENCLPSLRLSIVNDFVEAEYKILGTASLSRAVAGAPPAAIYSSRLCQRRYS